MEVSFSQRYSDESGETNTTHIPDNDVEASMLFESMCLDLMNAGAFQYDWSNCEAFASARTDSSGQVDAALFIIDLFHRETIITVIIRGADRGHFKALTEIAIYVTDSDGINTAPEASSLTHHAEDSASSDAGSISEVERINKELEKNREDQGHWRKI